MNALTTQAGASPVMMDIDKMSALMRFAETMAKAVVTVPDHLRGKPADCLAVAMQAVRWGMDPFVIAQKTHIVSGRLGYEAQLVNAVVQASGAIRGAFRYEFQGDGPSVACRVGAVLAGEQDVTWGEWLRASDVATKNSPLWKVNPKQQLGYLQVKNWSRLYCPGAILGVYTPDELEQLEQPARPAPRHMGDLKPSDQQQLPAPACPDELLSRAEDASLLGTQELRKLWGGLSKEERDQLRPHTKALQTVAAEADHVAADRAAADVQQQQPVEV